MLLRLHKPASGRRAAASMLKWDADVINVVSHPCFRGFHHSDPLNLHGCLTVAEPGSPSFLPGETLAVPVRWHAFF